MAEAENQEPAGPVAALRSAAELFRSYEHHHKKKLEMAKALARAHGGTAETLKVLDQEAAPKILRNREAAAMCERAARQIDQMAEAVLERAKPKSAGPTPREWFRLGFTYGQVAEVYLAASDEAKAERFPQGPPPPDAEGAWAEAIAKLATGLVHG